MTSNNLKNVAVVTGASSGIGREFVFQLANNKDIDEFWLIAREKDKLEEVASQLDKPSKVLSVDLSISEDLSKYETELKDANVNIKFLVNCAGYGKFEHEENLNTNIKLNMIDLNVKAIVSMVDFSLPYMSEGSGIINIASTAAFQPIPYINIYAATKSFVLHYSRALNKELEYRKIKVLAVCPYWTKTNFFNRAVRDNAKEVVIKYVVMYQAKDVVTKALKDFYKRKRDVSCYGFINSAQIFLTKILPHKLVMKIWMKQQKLNGTPDIREDDSVF